MESTLTCGAGECLLAAHVQLVGRDPVHRMISRYLAPRGLFVMVCPKPFHRHNVDVIQSMLLNSPCFDTHLVPVS